MSDPRIPPSPFPYIHANRYADNSTNPPPIFILFASKGHSPTPILASRPLQTGYLSPLFVPNSSSLVTTTRFSPFVPPHRFSVYEGNEILINFSPPPQRNALYHGVNCQHIFIEGREGKEEGITRVEYCAKHLSFSFFLFSSRERKRISKRFSPTMDKSPLPLLDENPANFELISRSISRAWSDNRDLICSLYIYIYI